MTEPSQGSSSLWSERSDLIVRMVLMIALGSGILSVLDSGFLPADDALRHAAQAVSGRGPNDFLVTDVTMKVVEATPGWQQVLG